MGGGAANVVDSLKFPWRVVAYMSLNFLPLSPIFETPLFTGLMWPLTLKLPEIVPPVNGRYPKLSKDAQLGALLPLDTRICPLVPPEVGA